MGSLESATETTAVISSSIAELAALAREREQCSPQDYIPSHTFRDEIERSAIDTPVELR
jgi:hypothetical protein